MEGIGKPSHKWDESTLKGERAMSKANGRKRTGEKKRCAVYYRVSTDEQDGSIERQRSQVQPYVEEREYKVVGVYADEGVAGDEFDKRKEFHRLLRDAAEGKFEMIVIDEFSRIGRMRPNDFIRKIAGPLGDAGICVDVVDSREIVDLNSDDLLQNIKLLLDGHKSLQEVVTLSRRVAGGMLNYAKSGQWVGGPAPYGYRIERIIVEGRKRPLPLLKIDPPKDDIVREIYSLYATGQSCRSIAKLLTQRGAEAPRFNHRKRGDGVWSYRAVRKILSNPVYKGALAWNRSSVAKYHHLKRGEAVKFDVPRTGGNRPRLKNDKDSVSLKENAGHPAIVTKAIWDAVQRILAERESKRGVRAGHKSPSAEKFVFSGLCSCGVCGYSMCGITRYPRVTFPCPGCKNPRVATLQPGKTEERCPCGCVFPIPEGEQGEILYRCEGSSSYGKKVDRWRAVAETELLHVIGADLEELIGEPEAWREQVVKTLTEAANVDPAKLKERKQALANLQAQIKTAVAQRLTLPPGLQATANEVLEGMMAKQSELEREIGELSESVSAGANVAEVADTVVRHLRIIRLHLVSGDRAKVRAILQRFVKKVTVHFDVKAKSASELIGMSTAYNENAFTTRSLVSMCAGLVTDMLPSGQPQHPAARLPCRDCV